MTWTRFMDMHSGGSLKEAHQYIYIEAPANEAEVVFYNRFGHSPSRVSCTCCGDDYSVSESANLEEASAFERGCRPLETPRDPDTGLYNNQHVWPTQNGSCYLEPGEKVPDGCELAPYTPYRRSSGETVLQYMETTKDAYFIWAQDITDKERTGDVPEQGYVWKE